MINQQIWIAITAGLFFVGIGVGFVVFMNSNQAMISQTNLVDQLLMQSPQHRQQMMQLMIQYDEQFQDIQSMNINEDEKAQKLFELMQHHMEQIQQNSMNNMMN